MKYYTAGPWSFYVNSYTAPHLDADFLFFLKGLGLVNIYLEEGKIIKVYNSQMVSNF